MNCHTTAHTQAEMLGDNYDVGTKVTDGVSFLFANVYGANIANKHQSRISHQSKELFLARRLCLRMNVLSIRILPVGISSHCRACTCKPDVVQSISPVHL